VFKKFAGHATAEDFSLEKVAEEITSFAGDLPEEGEVPVRLKGEDALRLAKRFGVTAGETQRLFPELSPFVEGSGLIDAPEEVQQAAEATLVAATIYGAAKTGKALFKLVQEKIAQRKAIREAAKEVTPDLT